MERSGIIALTLGGLAGGYLVSRQGLRFWLWPMVFIIHTPDLVFVYLSQVQPENFFLINAAVALEQFGYGFGFTAYMLYHDPCRRRVNTRPPTMRSVPVSWLSA